MMLEIKTRKRAVDGRKNSQLLRCIASFACFLAANCLFGFKLYRSWSFANHDAPSARRQRRLKSGTSKDRVLYIVTSIAEYDNGRRETIKGYDRFSNTLVPVVHESATSLVEAGYHVDVYLIAHYNVSALRYNELASQLPESVGLQVWEEASPIAYAREDSNETVMLHTRGLSRQHRYVIKDKFFLYDFFMAFEDDMLLRAAHVDHFIHMARTLFSLRKSANRYIPDVSTVEQAMQIFHGEMTQQQLSRTVPGFIRVEAALPDFKPGKDNRYDQIPVDFEWLNQTLSIDSSVCCHVGTPNDHMPRAPTANDLYFWETSIDALGVRQMDVIDWVLLLGGSNNEVWDDPAYVVGDYWSGRENNYFGKRQRPDRKKGRYMNNQGGWMATRFQVAEWHFRWCRGGFLPPFDLPFFRYDGLDLQSVEYWSGGIQLVGVNSCNLQRIVSLDPDGFSRHLLYHASNNKQRVRNVKYRFSGRSINEFWAQLNTVRKNAEAAMLRDEH